MNTPVSAPAADPLEGLRDIVMPASPPWWPPAPGWWIASALLLLTLMILGYLAWKKRREQLWRQRVLAEVDKAVHEHPTDRSLQIASLSEVLRRAALLRFPRDQVASLHGEAWLNFLDRFASDGFFKTPEAHALASDAWRNASGETALKVDDPLVQSVRAWVRRNLS